ncbi:hypothetical protein Tco_1236863 [Tanacetum coccineum]
MANLEFYDKHNMVAYLKKPTRSEGFQEIVDFLNGSHIRYALTKNPTIYVSLIEKFWQTATVRTVDNGEQEITATVDGKEFTITEASVRRHFQLANVDGISVLPTTIFEQLALMGTEGSWYDGIKEKDEKTKPKRQKPDPGMEIDSERQSKSKPESHQVKKSTEKCQWSKSKSSQVKPEVPKDKDNTSLGMKL